MRALPILVFKRKHNMNLDVIISYISLYIEAFFLTIRIGWLGILFALAIGLVVAFITHFKIPFLSGIALVYIEDTLSFSEIHRFLCSFFSYTSDFRK